MTVKNMPAGFSECDADKMAYDPQRDGVWIGDDVLIPRNVLIRAIGCLLGDPPKKPTYAAPSPDEIASRAKAK